MTAAYAGFANRGLVPHPVLIRRVEDRDGTVIYETRNAASRAISETTAFLMTTMMADVINAGTANGVRKLGFTLPAAGKTGTTNDFNDAWFIGYTPKLVTGAWVGFDRPHAILPRGFAAQVAVPMWAKFMKVATAGDKPEWFNAPSGITTAKVCRLSGGLATDGCGAVEVVDRNGGASVKSMVYTEYFDRGTEPTAYCDVHSSQGTSYDRIATMVGVTDSLAGSVPEGRPTEPGVAATTGVVEPESSNPDRKRSFWSIFRRDEAKPTASEVKLLPGDVKPLPGEAKPTYVEVKPLADEAKPLPDRAAPGEVKPVVDEENPPPSPRG